MHFLTRHSFMLWELRLNLTAIRHIKSSNIQFVIKPINTYCCTWVCKDKVLKSLLGNDNPWTILEKKISFAIYCLFVWSSYCKRFSLALKNDIEIKQKLVNILCLILIHVVHHYIFLICQLQILDLSYKWIHYQSGFTNSNVYK